jgi:hypothetical protein
MATERRYEYPVICNNGHVIEAPRGQIRDQAISRSDAGGKGPMHIDEKDCPLCQSATTVH